MKLSRTIGRFRLDRWLLGLAIAGGVALAGYAWLQDHPQHNPWAEFDLSDPPGWATAQKIADLRDDPASCRAVLERSNVAFTTLDPAGEGACRRPDRTVLSESALSPRPPSTCAVAAGFTLWMRRAVEPAAVDLLDSPVARVDHFGTYSCRRLYGRDSGPWSEHATGNALDVAGFVLEDGTRISVLEDWQGDDEKALFLRRIRDEACPIFATVLSPEYNEAHRDHFHLDQASRAWGACR